MQRRNRPGFTLVELLIVIIIIAVLAGLLVPAVMRAVAAANDAAIRSELSGLDQALAGFKNRYGEYPPSRIVIAEDGDYSASNLGKMAPLGQRSLGYLRRFWPRMVLAADGSKPSIQGGWYDVNGDHKKNAPYLLQGHECLVLFLGGVPFATDAGWAVSGFGKNPLNPFTSAALPPAGTSWPYADARTVPFFEFSTAKLVAATNPTMAGMGPMPGYTDYYGRDQFIVYFSAYGGAGYDPDDVNFSEPDSNGVTAAMSGALMTNNDPTGAGLTSQRNLVSSPSPNPYLADAPVPVDSAGALDPTVVRIRAYYRDSSYQLISAGRDRVFGIGGQYTPALPEPLPFYGLANRAVTGQALGNDARIVERDNITNFAGRRLD